MEKRTAGRPALDPELPVTVVMCREKPDYNVMAGALARSIHRFYEDPENERAFQEWKKARDAGQLKAV